MRIRFSHSAVVTALVVSIRVLVPGDAAAQNLLANGTFETDLSSWTAIGPTAFDATNDADGDPPGSAGFDGSLDNETATALISECVLVSDSNFYSLSGAILISEAPPTTLARLRVRWFDDATCGNHADTSTTNAVNVGDSGWNSVALSEPAQPISGILSAEIVAIIITESSGDVTVNFDNIVFEEADIVPTANGPWMAAAGFLLMTAGALAIRRRRRWATP